ncbi:MAG: cation transporter [Candidatus Daviesbacteria bacterium]|nr:cation transporter [Candidatus Daviesbacteria bacterium]
MSQTTVLQIKGMHCGACEKVISRRLGKLPGVSNVKVSLNEGTAEIESEEKITLEEASSILEGTDYQVTNSN